MKSAEKIKFSLFFVCFRFTERLYFLSFPLNENVRKKHLSANAYFCVNMKFLYMIAGRKDKMSYFNENKQFFASIYVNFLLTICKRKDEILCHIAAKTSHWSTFP